MSNCNFYYTCNELDWFFPCWHKFQEENSQCILEEERAVFYNSVNHTLLLEGSILDAEGKIVRSFESFYLDLLQSKPSRGMFCVYLKACDTGHMSMIIEFVARLADLQHAGSHIDILWLYTAKADASYVLGEYLMEDFPELKMILRSVSALRKREKIQTQIPLQELMKDPMFRVNMRMTMTSNSQVDALIVDAKH